MGNTALGTEFARSFYAGIGPLKLGVVLVLSYYCLICCDLDIDTLFRFVMHNVQKLPINGPQYLFEIVSVSSAVRYSSHQA